ncbi:50S ribosomal protein L21 [Defluviicoccus vanus]|uniref:Large ribosomal subunit protein bL21 n=1 Tax=Defluviicoccus vanus TaxID=111831 RepID=A0A7H1N0P4_9PROT|nr:50S ribosomal protein L21 [Defluviicoccus vanus]QNT69280.1 50S ribosomal protein L21 [Defluviicoccus vanus]
MFAVIRTGGKQHRVAANDRIVIERLTADAGDAVEFDDIIMLAPDGEAPLVGDAVPDAARVFGKVVEQTRGPKLLIFKKKRRKNHRRMRGHRQDLTVVKISGVSLDGSVPVAAAAEAPMAAVATPAVEEQRIAELVE